MKVFIIAALTADGFVGKDSHHFVDWTGKEDVKQFVRLTKEAGVVVMGSHTFKTVRDAGRRLPGRRIIVLTSRPDKISGERVETTSESPQVLVGRLRSEGVSGIAVCGGASVYDQFIRAGVVDELFLSLSPIIFGKGLSLFSSPIEQRLELQKSEALQDGTVTLNYVVLNNKS